MNHCFHLMNRSVSRVMFFWIIIYKIIDLAYKGHIEDKFSPQNNSNVPFIFRPIDRAQFKFRPENHTMYILTFYSKLNIALTHSHQLSPIVNIPEDFCPTFTQQNKVTTVLAAWLHEVSRQNDVWLLNSRKWLDSDKISWKNIPPVVSAYLPQ